MGGIAISVKDVCKSFMLPHERHSGLKQAIIGFRPGGGFETQHVLKGVSFDIKKGEFFGVVGRNGSGKSTLLKILAQIYAPNSGTVKVNGSLTPFIELGVGFNPELTGKENVYLNGALLGFDRKQMDEMYSEIVEFAELEKFMDQKLKNYSSGMQVRLAFSIAIQAKSDILVLDEVLAVGDEAFQKKCARVFEEYKANDKTIILVTHDMGAVERFCDRAMFLQEGRVVKVGDPRHISMLYSASNVESYNSSEDKRLEKAVQMLNYLQKPILRDDNGNVGSSFNMGDYINLQLSWRDDVASIKNVGVALLKLSGEYIFGANTLRDNEKLREQQVSYRLLLDIAPGEYRFQVALFGETENQVIEWVEHGPSFTVLPSKNTESWGGLTFLDHEWLNV